MHNFDTGMARRVPLHLQPKQTLKQTASDSSEGIFNSLTG